MITLDKDELQDYIKNYIINTLTIEGRTEHGYYQEYPDTVLTIKIDGEEVSEVRIDGN